MQYATEVHVCLGGVGLYSRSILARWWHWSKLYKTFI